MANLTRYETYFNRYLKPILGPLEKERQKSVTWYLILGCLLVILVAVVGTSWTTSTLQDVPGIENGIENGVETIIIGLVFCFIALYIGFAGLNQFCFSSFRKQYKKTILQPLIQYIDENLIYTPQDCIRKHDYVDSMLYRTSVDIYSGEDHFCGVIGETAFECSELHTQYETTDSKGNRHVHTIFNGLFFMADFNKEFKGETYVLPDRAESLLGFIGKGLQQLDTQYGQLVQLENPEFEKCFKVCGSDQIEARYILSTHMMERLLDFKKKAQSTVRISFRQSRMFIAIENKKDYFEPKCFDSLLDFNNVKHLAEDIIFLRDIIDDMNLNTRIWTKTTSASP